jgi:GcrA cell cycle regulator
MSSRFKISWSSDEVRELERLFNEGHPDSHIAKKLHMSLNAVIGKRNRLGLSKSRTSAEGARTKMNGQGSQEPQTSKVIRLPEAVDSVSRYSDEVFAPTTCQWPLGDPRDSDFSFCGALSHNGAPYCEEHFERAYNVEVNKAIRKAARQRKEYRNSKRR